MKKARGWERERDRETERQRDRERENEYKRMSTACDSPEFLLNDSICLGVMGKKSQQFSQLVSLAMCLF